MTRHALLVGIDRYPGFPECSQLSSCAGDARLMAEVLRDDFEFPPDNVELLLNEEATRQGILDALEGLARRVRSGDTVVFYYSGHGSEAKDEEGGRLNLEVDDPTEWEQTLVPHDSGREHRLPCRDIRDDEIYRWIRKVNDTTPYVTVILDSCHAGTAVRGSVRTKRVPREENPEGHRAPDYRPFLLGEAQARRSATPAEARWRDAGPSGWLPLDERYTLLAACHHLESAKEYEIPGAGGLKHGAFTWHLVRELRRLEPGATFRDLMEAVRSTVNAVYPSQTPQVEGARDREVFGTVRRAPQRFLAVREREGDRVVLDGGAAHGVLPGSEWAIHPPGTRRFDDASAAAGRVRVVAVRAVSAEAEIVSEGVGRQVERGEGSGITAGCRAVELVHREELVLPVAVDEGTDEGTDEETEVTPEGDRLRPLLAALGSRIEASSLLRRVGSGEEAQTIVRVVPAAGSSEEPGEVPCWSLHTADGAPLRTPHPVFETGSVQRVVDNLASRARFLHLERLVDREPANPLSGTVEVSLLRWRPTRSGEGSGGGNGEGSWIAAVPETADGEVVFLEGERLGLELVHRFEDPLHLHVFDLGLTGGVCLLHPVPGASQALEPGRPLRIGTRPGEGLTVRLPEEFPRAKGRERIRVIATTHPADLSGWEQGRYRGPGIASALERRFDAGFRGGTFREGAAGEAPAHEHWTAVTESFLVARNGSAVGA